MVAPEAAVTLLIWMVLACTDEEHACDEATITLESITSDPLGMSGTTGIACGAIYEARDDGITNDCATDTGLGEPDYREGTYAIWPSDWGLSRNGFSVGVNPLDVVGYAVPGMPEGNVGDSIAVDVVVRFDEVYDPCSHSVFGSAYLEISAGDVGL